MYLCMHACLYVWMYVCMHVCLYVRAYACMNVYMCLRVSVCMYVCITVALNNINTYMENYNNYRRVLIIRPKRDRRTVG
jgi:uncharacterized membrane protein